MDKEMKRILVIDDEEWICNLLQDFLSEEGFDVQLGMSLAEADERLFKGILPDALILDVMLPDGNGIEYLGKIRSHPETRHLPVIVISAHRIQIQDRIEGFEQGADDYIIKPFDLKEFKLRLERLLIRIGNGVQMRGDHSPSVPASSHKADETVNREKPSDPKESQSSPTFLSRILNFLKGRRVR